MEYEYKLLNRSDYASDEAFFRAINKFGKLGWRMMEGTYRKSQYSSITVVMEAAYRRYTETD